MSKLSVIESGLISRSGAAGLKNGVINVKQKRTVTILALLLVVVLLAALAGCSSGGEKKTTYTVGVCQLMQHVALDDATAGFVQALYDELGEENVKINIQNASGEMTLCNTIASQFIAENVDLIMANATPALQAVCAATADIPVIGTSVTEYGVALGIENFNGTVGGNVSGASDLASLQEQAAMVKEWFPDVKTVGLLYCSAEANSQYQVDVMKAELEKLGYTCEYASFSDSNDLAGVVEHCVSSYDLIYVPTDNVVANNTEIIANICRPAKFPVIGGDGGICGGCTVATLCVEYYDLGYVAGQMAAKVLTGQADISEMPIAYAEASKVYNAEICAELGLTPLEGYAPLD